MASARLAIKFSGYILYGHTAYKNNFSPHMAMPRPAVTKRAATPYRQARRHGGGLGCQAPSVAGGRGGAPPHENPAVV